MIEPVKAIPQRPAVNALNGQSPRLLEILQQGAKTSSLLSALPGPGAAAPSAPAISREAATPFAQAGTVVPSISFAQRASGFGDPLATLRSAQAILQAVGTSGSAGSSRIASEAYLMELQARQDLLNQQASRTAGTREWFA